MTSLGIDRLGRLVARLQTTSTIGSAHFLTLLKMVVILLRNAWGIAQHCGMDPGTLMQLASLGVEVLRATGLIEDSADRIAIETQEDVRAIMRKDFNAGMNALKLAAHTDREADRDEALVLARRHFLVAESHDGLPRHFQGLAAGLLASLAYRNRDRGAARMWANKAIDHYDAAFRGLDQSASKAIKVLNDLEDLRGPYAPIFLIYYRERLRQATAVIPSDDWLKELGQQAEAVHQLASELGVANGDSASGLELDRRKAYFLPLPAPVQSRLLVHASDGG